MTDITAAKVITFNRETKDFDAYFETNYIGSFANRHLAENALNDHVLLLCEQGLLDQPLAALAEQALAAANPTATIPDGTAPDDYSDVPAGPNEPKRADGNWSTAPGRAIFRHFHKRPRHFIETLRRLDPAIWQVLASAYVAYRGGTVDQTLTAWWLAVSETQHIPADYRADFVVHPIVQAADASAESYAGV